MSPGRRHTWFLFAVISVLGVLFWRPWIGSGYDDLGYYAHLSSPLFDGDIDHLNDIYFSNDPLGTVQNYAYCISPSGRLINYFAVGSSALRTPFVAAVRSVGWVTEIIDPSARWPGDRYSLPYMWAYGAGTLVFFAAGILLVYLSCRRFASSHSALLASCCAAGATQWTGYGTMYNGMAHGISAFAVSLLLYATIVSRKLKTTVDYLFISASTAIVFLVRWQDAAAIVLPLSIIFARIVRRNRLPDRKQEIVHMLLAVGMGLALAASQMSNWFYIFRQFIAIPQGSGYMAWTRPNITGVLFSPFYGLFYCHPVLFLGAVGLLIGGIVGRGRCLILAVVAAAATMIYVDSTSGEWHGSYGYGHRRLTSIVPLFALGLACLFERIRFRRRLFPTTITVVFCALNVLLFVLFIRSQTRLFFWSEIIELPLRILAETARRVTTSLAYNPGTAAACYYERNTCLAVTSVLTSLAAAACGCLLGLRLIPRLSRSRTFYAVLVACSAGYSIFCLLQTRPDSAWLREFKVMSPNKVVTDPDKNQLAQLEEMWKRGCRYPGVSLWAVQGERSNKERQRVWLERLKETDDSLWAKAILDVPTSHTTPLELQIAQRYKRETPGNIPVLLNSEIGDAGRSRNKQQISDAFRKYLRFYPLSTVHMFTLSTLTNDKTEAAALQSKSFQISEAQMRAMFLNMATLPKFWRGYILERSYVDRVNTLINHYTATNNPDKAMELYNRVFAEGLVRPTSAYMVRKPLQKH